MDNDEPVIVSEGQKLELRAGMETLSDGLSFSDSVFFACGAEAGMYTDIWKAGVQPNGRIGFSEAKYYPSDDSRIYLRGFAPEGEQSGNGQIVYSMDGRQDVLITDEQNGCLTDMFWQEGKRFEFVHLLSQLRFRFRCDEAGKENGWKLISLVVDGVQRNARLSLADKALFFSGEKDTITVFDRMGGDELRVLDTDWTDVPEIVTIQPGVEVSLTVVVEGHSGRLIGFEHLPVTFHEEDNLPVSGTSYLLSVRLRTEEAISLSVAVLPWKTGSPGSGTIKD